MPKFSKRHYVAIADVLCESMTSTTRTLFTQAETERFARLLADRFERDNPAFARDRFLTACGLSAEKDRK